MSCHIQECAHAAISGGEDISEVSGYHLLQQMNSQWGSQKLLQEFVSHELAVHLWNLYIFWKGHEPDNLNHATL